MIIEDRMPDASPQLLDTLARRAALEAFTIESEPAFFETGQGERTAGYAAVSVSRSSIAIRFVTGTPLTLAKAGYGESDGRIGAMGGAWLAQRVNAAGHCAAGNRLFGTQELVMNHGVDEERAVTRLVFAGAAWQGSELLDGRRVNAAPLSREAVNHHDARMSITAEGDLDEARIEAMHGANSFVAGLDLELLRIDGFCAQGDLIQARHLRGFRRLGRGPHSPFTGIADEHRMRAWVALVTAIPRLEREGVPIIPMINHIASHNTVAEINTSAVLLLLATQTAAHHRMHGREVGAGAASRRQELMLLSRELNLRLSDHDLDRFEKLRVELLDAGFFHHPGYETGRPQQDIKFLRDIAHMTVFRLCGYSGPFYGAETFAVRDIPADA
jgi:hypothetical protein